MGRYGINPQRLLPVIFRPGAGREIVKYLIIKKSVDKVK